MSILYFTQALHAAINWGCRRQVGLQHYLLGLCLVPSEDEGFHWRLLWKSWVTSWFLRRKWILEVHLPVYPFYHPGFQVFWCGESSRFKNPTPLSIISGQALCFLFPFISCWEELGVKIRRQFAGGKITVKECNWLGNKRNIWGVIRKPYYRGPLKNNIQLLVSICTWELTLYYIPLHPAPAKMKLHFQSGDIPKLTDETTTTAPIPRPSGAFPGLSGFRNCSSCRDMILPVVICFHELTVCHSPPHPNPTQRKLNPQECW